MKPLVSVVIVSFNTRDLTLRSVESVYASKGFKKGEIEVIVVDNSSTDDTVKVIGKSFENFRLIINDTNVGFGTANNQGANIAKGKYLLLLNSDAFLSPGTLRTLVDTLESRNDLYSTAPQLKYQDGHIQPSTGYSPTPLRVLGWMWGLDKLPLTKLLFTKPYHIFDINWHTHKQYPDWLMGACIIFRTKEFLRVGGFDEKIFMYSEEVDLYMRLSSKLKKRVLFDPSVQVIHFGGTSHKLSLELKGVKYIYMKHFTSLAWFINFIIYSGVVLRILIFSLIPTRRDTVLEYKSFLKS